MYPQNIYEKTIKDNCKVINIEQFKPILLEVKTHKLQTFENYVLEGHFVKGRTVSKIRYELGYRGTSQIYNKIRNIISILREIINFRYCDKNDYLSLFIGNSVVKGANIKDCTIQEAIELYSKPDYIYRNYYDEVISYTLLKRFSYPANLLHMYSLRSKDPKIALYHILYGKEEPKISGDDTFQYLFIKNIGKALKLIDINDSPYSADSIYFTMALNPIPNVSQALFDRIRTNHFTKLVCDPGCLYSDEYFDHKDAKEISLDYLALTMSQSLYDICVHKLHIPTLFGLMYCMYSIDHNMTSKDIIILEDLIDSICIVNDNIRESKEYMQNFIKETKEYL